jgi:hypothetical protein
VEKQVAAPREARVVTFQAGGTPPRRNVSVDELGRERVARCLFAWEMLAERPRGVRQPVRTAVRRTCIVRNEPPKSRMYSAGGITRVRRARD